jgi:glycosyltransferase involved in cell wall biosynthesis
MNISVIICTHNRAAPLLRTLASLKKMSVPEGLEWEIIVVDNNSADRTAAIVEEFARTSDLKVRYIFETRQGKSYALNNGVDTACGDIIAFTDDDIVVSSNWLAVIQEEFSRDLALRVISGRVELLNPADLPITIQRRTTRAESNSPNGIFGLMVGCNFAARRTVSQSVGGFDTELGPGSRWMSYEDGDFFFRCQKAGLKLVYEPAMLVYHDHGRRGAKAERHIRRSYDVGAGAFYAKHTLLGDRLAPRQMYWRVHRLALDFYLGTKA